MPESATEQYPIAARTFEIGLEMGIRMSNIRSSREWFWLAAWIAVIHLAAAASSLPAPWGWLFLGSGIFFGATAAWYGYGISWRVLPASHVADFEWVSQRYLDDNEYDIKEDSDDH